MGIDEVNFKDQRILIAGGAGFIGSHLTEELIARGAHVTVFDNLKTGRPQNLTKVQDHANLRFVRGDIRDRGLVNEIVPGHDLVFHFCDDSDIRSAALHPDSYVEQNIMGLFYMLEAMRKNGIKKVLFPSSTTVLGEVKKWPASEEHGPLMPMSLYGGAKVASEGLLSAWAHTYDMQAIVFRFVGIIGGRMDHGVVHDFVRKLEKDPEKFEVLGDGTQQRSFVLVNDCVDAMLTALVKCDAPYSLVHIGNQDQIPINDVAAITKEITGRNGIPIAHTGGKVGWKGDSTSNFILTETLDRIGWKPKHSSAEAVREAARRIFDEGARA